MLKIGLTGGIGCGKTTVANLFAAHGTPVIDADAVARHLVAPGRPALQQIRRMFGNGVIGDDGILNRAALREVVFGDAEKRRQLEALMHPLVYQEMQRLAEDLQSAYAILTIPLLLETKMQSFVDRIAVVDCPEQLQIDRVKQRDGIAPHTIAAIMQAQVSRQQRLAAAHDVIDNSGDATALARQVEKLHNFYLTLRTL